VHEYATRENSTAVTLTIEDTKTGEIETRTVAQNQIEWLEENYATPDEATNSKKYKYWLETVFPFGGPDNYIDYLVELNIL
jgi:hypothetical protein